LRNSFRPPSSWNYSKNFQFKRLWN